MESAMTKGRIALLGSAMAVLLCGAGMANAQDYSYSNGPYNDAGYQPGNYDRSYNDGRVVYDDQVGQASETIIVHPNDMIEEQQVIGRVGGEVNPQAYTVSRNIDFSDLDLRHGEDRAALHERIEQTAANLCAELDERVPGLRGDHDADHECVRDATRHAMEDVMDRVYG
jgi:UrcA family protein